MPAFDPNKAKADVVKKITASANTKAKKFALRLAAELEPQITAAVNNFFRSIVPLLGHEADLASQVAIPGLIPWQPLNLEYIKRKGHVRFFLQRALSTGHQHTRRDPWDILNGRTTQPLLDILEKTHGFHAFGHTKITVTDWRKLPVTLADSPAPTDVNQIKFTLNIRPWGALHKSDLFKFERWLESQGIIDKATRIKLTNPRGTKRPALAPWLVHYSDVVIPSMIQQALRDRYQMNVRVHAPPFYKGPYA